MYSRRSVVALLSQALLAGLVVGCAPEPKPLPPPPPPMATPAQAAAIQKDFTKFDPNARVGTVVSVRGDASLAAVSGISPKEVRIDDAITFTDSTNAVVANGTITTIDETNGSFLIVKYTPTSSGRAPQAGDLAYRFLAK